MYGKKFPDLKKSLIEELGNKDWKTKTHFYSCNSFYDFFIGCFSYVHYSEFNLYIHNNSLNQNGKEWHIPREKFKQLTEKEENYSSKLLQISKMMR